MENALPQQRQNPKILKKKNWKKSHVPLNAFKSGILSEN